MDVQTPRDCGCSELRVSRRRLLQGALGAAGAAVMSASVGDVFAQVAYGVEADANVLVVLSLRGGADGLSMLVPYGDHAYVPHRPQIAIPPETLLATDGMFGLHPAFAPLMPMWSAGKFAAVHAVGLPQPNRSHFAAMEAIEDADSTSASRRGWINRMVGLTGLDEASEAMQLGSPVVPTSLYGSAPTLATDRLSNLSLPGSRTSMWRSRQTRALTGVWGDVPGPLGRGARAALSTAERLTPLSQTPVLPQHGAVYPAGDLGRTFAEAATLIRAGIGTRVITLDYGGWDMHTSMGKAHSGPMRERIDEMSRALAAFFTDLGPAGDRVTLVTLSEFGRRVRENGAHGLDHGHGNCVLLLGGGVQGGRYYGKWPGLDADTLTDGDLAVTTDYRDVLAAITRARFPETNLSRLFPGVTTRPMDIMRATV
jgi:uncharacterized protein (DUF1501 family)